MRPIIDIIDHFDIMWRMVKVEFTAEAQRGLEDIPLAIRLRCYGIMARLREWPDVSGAKPLRGEFKGCFRIRTGDWRIVIRPKGSVLWIVRIDNRKDVYER
jgi:mRNA-degrading endonuclease RelE of RelBE toxin-antitoxin system